MRELADRDAAGPLSDSGGMIAFTRLPSGRRASTIGEDSSMRRPTWATILLMIRRRCDSSLKRDGRLVQPARALDPDVERAVDHDLRDGVVGEQPLERAVAEDVVGDVLDQARSRSSREMPGLVAELVADVAERRARAASSGSMLTLKSCGPEVADHGEVNPVLQLRERISGSRRRGDGACGGETLVQFHRYLPAEQHAHEPTRCGRFDGGGTLGRDKRGELPERRGCFRTRLGQDDRRSLVDGARDVAVARDADCGARPTIAATSSSVMPTRESARFRTSVTASDW